MRSRIDSRIQKAFNSKYIEESSEVIKQAIEEIEAYFRGEKKTLNTIIGSNGDLVGYAGGLDVKRKLLEIENNLFS